MLLDLDLALARRVFNGSQERFRRGGGRDFLDDHGGFVLDFDLGAHLDLPGAVLIFAGVHQAAGLEIRQALERLLLQDGDLRLEQFGEIMRQNARTTCPTAMPSVPSISSSGSLHGSATGSLLRPS